MFAEKLRVELSKLTSLRDLRYGQPLDYPSLEVTIDRDRAGQFRSIALAVGDGAGYGIDDDVFRSGIVLGAVGVGDVEYIAREFDDGVLESAASAEEGPVAAAGELNAFEHAVETLIRAAGRGPEAVERLEFLLGVSVRE